LLIIKIQALKGKEPFISDTITALPVCHTLKLNYVIVVLLELCPADLSQEVQAEIQKLRDCISVLFMFVRQPIQDEEFVTILNGWMEQLVWFASLVTFC